MKFQREVCVRLSSRLRGFWYMKRMLSSTVHWKSETKLVDEIIIKQLGKQTINMLLVSKNVVFSHIIRRHLPTVSSIMICLLRTFNSRQSSLVRFQPAIQISPCNAAVAFVAFNQFYSSVQLPREQPVEELIRQNKFLACMHTCLSLQIIPISNFFQEKYT